MRRHLGECREVDLVLLEAVPGHVDERRPSVPHVQLVGDRVGNLDHDGARRGRELRRDVDAEIVQDAGHIPRPADRDCGRADHVFEDQVPADQPGDELAHRGISVSISRSGDRNGRGHLGVAEAGECTGDAADDERQRDRRPGVLGRGMTGQYEEARTDDCPDAERDQVGGGERPLQAVLVTLRGLGLQSGDRFPYPQIGHLFTLTQVKSLGITRASFFGRLESASRFDDRNAPEAGRGLPGRLERSLVRTRQHVYLPVSSSSFTSILRISTLLPGSCCWKAK